ncbi:MAG: YfhO family protein [Eggerthellaceae bacterium]|nr:YfhO family protein [Eggerthellaceae bacterium]
MLVFISFYLFNNRLFLWKVDGLEQQYPFFILFGKWLRELLTNLASFNFTIPMWTEYVGYGAEYLFLVFSCFGNPINLLAVFATEDTAEFLLYLTVPLTLYLSGLSFIVLCHYFKFEKFYIFFAALTYCFAGYSFIAFSQIFMLYPLVLSPLTVLGLEKIFKEKKYLLFTVVMILNFGYSVEHSFNVFLLTVLYFLVRSFIPEEPFRFKDFILRVFKIFLFAFFAFIIASPLLNPQIGGILMNSRLGLDRPFDPFYPSPYYSKSVGLYLSVVQVGPDCYSGFFAIFILCLFVMLFRKKKDKSTKRLLVFFLILTIFMLIPIFGRIFNGFAYANNRWIWAYTLLVSFINAKEGRNIWDFVRANKHKSFVFTLVIIAILVFPSFLSTELSAQEFVFKILSYLTLLVLLIAFLFINNKTLLRTTAFGILVVVIAFNCYVVSSSALQGWEHNVVIGQANDEVIKQTQASISNEKRSGNCKFDYFISAPLRNYNQVNYTKASSFYNSFYNPYIDNLHNALGLTSADINFGYSCLEGRTPLDLLCGITNLVTPKANSANPLIWEEDTISSSCSNLYKSKFDFPKIFTYKDSISEKDFYKQDFTERQALLLDKLVVENDADSTVDPDVTYVNNLPFELISSGDSNIEIYENKIITKEKNAAVYISTDIPAGSDAYLNIKNIECVNPDPTGRETLNFVLGVNSDNSKTRIYGRNAAHQLSSGKKDWSAHLGYSENARRSIVLNFSTAGIYNFDKISVNTTNLKMEQECIEKICTNAAQDIMETQNGFSCKVATSVYSKYLFFSIPYSDTWKAKVDGQIQELKRANIGFMYLQLEPGQHNIELRYQTPWLDISTIISVTAILISIVALMVYNFGTPSNWYYERKN